jgi:hypothetical protein
MVIPFEKLSRNFMMLFVDFVDIGIYPDGPQYFGFMGQRQGFRLATSDGDWTAHHKPSSDPGLGRLNG